MNIRRNLADVKS